MQGENLKLNRNKYFQVHKVTVVGKIISRSVVQPDPQKLLLLTKMPPPVMRKNYNQFRHDE